MNALKFGKWKDVPIDEVPIDYITWMLGQKDSKYPQTTKMLQESLARRQGGTTRPAPASGDAQRSASDLLPCPSCGAMLSVTLTESEVPF